MGDSVSGRDPVEVLAEEFVEEIRGQLAQIGLDWDLPPYPPAVDEGPPLHVVVE
jgi:hypothetical protein